jgi:hypothetical protein
MVSQAVASTTNACSQSALSTFQNEIRKEIPALFTVVAPIYTSPTASMVTFMILSKILHQLVYLQLRWWTLFNMPVTGKDLASSVNKSIFIPSLTSADFPALAADITKLCTTSAPIRSRLETVYMTTSNE